jgi:hypothetical protein
VDAIGDLLDARGFGEGAVMGAIAFAVVLLVAWRFDHRRAYGAGVAVAVAAMVAMAGLGPLDGAGRLPPGVPVGVALLALGGLVLRRFGTPLWLGAVVYAPGAAVLAYGADLDLIDFPGWVSPLVLVATAAGGALAADTDRARTQDALAPTLLAISIAAVYTTVPDTEHIVVLVGAALALVAYTVPTPIAPLGPEGVGAAVGLLLWTAAVDGRGRPGSIVGAVGCLGLLLAEPLGRRVTAWRAGTEPVRRSRPTNTRNEHLAVVGLFALVQIAIAAYAARIAGTETGGAAATALLAPALLAAVLVATGLPPPRPRQRRASRRGSEGRPVRMAG